MSRRRRASVSKAPEPAPNSWRTRERWGCGRQLGNLAGWAEWVGRGGAWVSIGACAYAGAWLAWVWGLLAVLGSRDLVWRRSAVVGGCDVFVRCPGGAGNHPVFPLRHTPILIPHTQLLPFLGACGVAQLDSYRPIASHVRFGTALVTKRQGIGTTCH